MRNAFADEVTKIAAHDARVVLLSGDIGNKLFDGFKSKAAAQFFNCGVAEANMISVAAGLASEGFRPVAYTITPFITYRALEQIRLDCCYHKQPVVIVGVGSGLGYTSLGATHHSLEEIACLRALPEMTVLCPGDPHEVRGALRVALTLDGPSYIRLGKKGEPKIHADEPRFEIGRPIQVVGGSRVCILACGTILADAREVVNQLSLSGVSPSLYSFHTVKPLNGEFLSQVFREYEVVVTYEEHSLLGGFGSAVSEWFVDSGTSEISPRGRLLRIGTPDEFFHKSGERHFALEGWKLRIPDVAHTILSNVNR